MSFRSLLIAASIALLPAIACALSVPALPAGMCALNHNVPVQATVLDYLKAANAGSNDVIAAFADCKELAAIDAGKASSIQHYGAVLRQNLGQKLPIARSAYVEAAASAFTGNSELVETALTQARESATQATMGSDVANPKSLTADAKRVLFKNADMAIIGMKQNNQFGSTVLQVASIAAMTLISGEPVSVNLYAPAAQANAFTQGSATLQPFVTKLIAANPQ